MIQGAQFGTIEFFIAPPGFLRGADPRVQVGDAPGLFQDMEHAQKTLTDPRFHDKFLNVTTAKGIRGVMIWNIGPTAYASSSPLRKLDDFRGKKIRVLASKVEIESMARIGVTGVPLDFSEVTTALQNKTLDGARSSVVPMTPMKFYNAAKYLTTVNDTMIPIGGWVSTAWLEKLPADLRAIVLETAPIDEQWVFEASVEANERLTKEWKESGGEVLQLPPEDQAEFMKRVSAVADEVYGKDPVLGEMYQLYKEVARSHRKK
jgi:C4-dicarboxylate-binding protein DctP